jgi:hypothetical protein
MWHFPKQKESLVLENLLFSGLSNSLGEGKFDISESHPGDFSQVQWKVKDSRPSKVILDLFGKIPPRSELSEK